VSELAPHLSLNYGPAVLNQRRIIILPTKENRLSVVMKVAALFGVIFCCMAPLKSTHAVEDEQNTATRLRGLIQSTQLSDKDVLDAVLEGLKARPDNRALREALIVQLANGAKIAMYGRQINDTLSSLSGRRKYDLHPYGKTGSGANVLPVYTDEAGKTFVLLARKFAVHKDPSKGLAAQYILPGGYMAPHVLEGGEVQEALSAEEKDAAEEAILLGKKGYKNTKKKSLDVNLVKKEAAFDATLEDAVIRELREEANLVWDKNQGLPRLPSLGSRYGVTNVKNLRTIVGNYFFDFGKLKKAPNAKAGSDIAEVIWVPLDHLRKIKGIAPQQADSKESRYLVVLQDGTRVLLRDYHGEVIETFAKEKGLSLLSAS